MSHLPLTDETLHQLGYLVGSVAILGFAPLLHAVSRRSPRVAPSIDLVVGLVTLGLVGLHVLPECVEIAGSPALLAAIAGALLPTLFEQRLRVVATRATALLAAVALALHAVVDGLAIAGAHAGHGHAHGLELAVILHRLSFSAALWWFLRPRGRAVAVGALCLLGGATIVGFGLGSAAAAVSGANGALFQAFVGGMVLHVLLHRPVVRVVDAVLPWALPGVFVLLGFAALTQQGEREVPAAVALLGIAFVLMMPWRTRLHIVGPDRGTSARRTDRGARGGGRRRWRAGAVLVDAARVPSSSRISAVGADSRRDACPPSWMSSWFRNVGVIEDHASRRRDEVVELPRAHGSHEREHRDGPEHERDREGDEQHAHGTEVLQRVSRDDPTTLSELRGIRTAATRGLIMPLAARATANEL